MTKDNWPKQVFGVQYGAILDDEGSMDYYDTAVEAWYASGGQPIAKVTTEELDCICYSHADPRCEIHGY